VLCSGLAFVTVASLSREEVCSLALPLEVLHETLEVSHEIQNDSESGYSRIAPHPRTVEEILHDVLPAVISKVFTVQNAIFFWKFSMRAILDAVRAAVREADTFTNVCICTLVKSRPIQQLAAVITAAISAVEDIKSRIMQCNISSWPLVTEAAQEDLPQLNVISDDYGTFSSNVSEDTDRSDGDTVEGAAAVVQTTKIWPSGRMATGAAILSSVMLFSVVLKRIVAPSASRHMGSYVPKAITDR
jgi:hypothetical protein